MGAKCPHFFGLIMPENYPMLSALQHLDFCPRQCALIHVEKQWAENPLTIQGEQLHEKVDSGFNESRKELYLARTLRIISHEYQIAGVADMVEFRQSEDGVCLPNKFGLWKACPVEYKRGKSKIVDADRIQLCAQALCLEEMLGCQISQAAIYYGLTKTREWVDLDTTLRDKTKSTISELHELIRLGKTPTAIYDSKCKSCSMIELCQPKSLDNTKATKIYKSLFEPVPNEKIA